MEKNKTPFLKRPAVQTLLASLICIILGLLVGFVVLPVLIIVWLVCSIIDIVKASSGDTSFRFPLTIDFLK